MRHGALLCDVDLLTAKHRLDSRLQAGLIGESKKKFERLVGDAILGIVQVEAHGFDRHPLAAIWIVREELSQMQLRRLLVVRVERVPRLALDRRPFRVWLFGICHYSYSLFRFSDVGKLLAT